MSPAYLTDAERASQALREHEASLPAGQVELATLEFRHPSLTQPVRVVHDRADHDLTLEASAPVNPAESVTFQKSAFDMSFPAQQEDRSPEVQLEAMNANAILERVLDDTLATDAPVDLTVRVWLSTDTSAPAAVVEGLQIRASDADDRSVKAMAGTYVWEKAAGLVYTRQTHPLLGGR